MNLAKVKCFQRMELLKKHKTYIWSVSPKFIDEDNIAYVSELPWIKKRQYNIYGR